MIAIGTVLYGFCAGQFGRDSYDDKRVEGFGADWVVARERGGFVVLANCTPAELEPFTDPMHGIGEG